jgi:hypothetical protein
MWDHVRRGFFMVVLLVGLVGSYETTDLGVWPIHTEDVVVASPCKILVKYDPSNKDDKHEVAQASTLIRGWANDSQHVEKNAKGDPQIRFIPTGLTKEDFHDDDMWFKAYTDLTLPVPSASISNAGGTYVEQLPDGKGMTDQQYEEAILAIFKKYGGQ